MPISSTGRWVQPESRDWYYKSQPVLGETVIQHRLRLLTEIIRLLLTMVPQQRGRTLREPTAPYQTASNNADPDKTCTEETPINVFQDVPFA